MIVVATSDRMKYLRDQGADPSKKRLKGSAYRVTMNKACTAMPTSMDARFIHCDTIRTAFQTLLTRTRTFIKAA